MRVRRKYIGLYLTGGLGNQLFQFAAALTLAENREIRIFGDLGKPRLNIHGNPELFSFKIDQVSTVSHNSKNSFIVSKSAGYLLRSNIWPRRFEKPRVIRTMTRVAATIVQSFILRDLLFPITISKVGYQLIRINRLSTKIFNPLLIGYFQSSVWPMEVQNQLKVLTLCREGPALQELKLQSQAIKPIVVHIRRGDYRNESTFGLLGSDYYSKAFEIIQEQFANHPIWVFSDEISEAKSILAFIPQNRIQYIADVDCESAASLTAMRYGCAYIIANSTFSWWGAFLSTSENPLVIAPEPWFVGQIDPLHLIPENWIRIKI